ncbi:MAG: sigma-54-dependent Fis family transcriptional regulator [Phycisphaeraceae bacterium]|nr:MAG: sigma-54-dependent Fis family transcriptional regulator [Phycisphaeraceae bacterium]
MSTNILVVDDKELMRDGVCETLRRAGFEVHAAGDGREALAAIARRRPDVVVTDMRMPGMGGVELLAEVRRLDEDLPVLVMTAFATIDTAVAAMRQGAFDYLTKPFEGDELIIAVKRAVEHRRVVRENQVLRAQAAPEPGPAAGGERPGLDRLVGDSPAMTSLKAQLSDVAKSQGTVLITGESGAGKEVIARAIHETGARASGPFLAVNCAALSESILESELFGHERGAFTGADKLRKGRFELADGGTLLLDEVSEVSPKVQAKLLRVLQERTFERVGSSVSIGVDVRVIATSNRDLPAAVARGEFRQDLYYRLSVLPINAPPLRERPGDVHALARHFIDMICRREGRPAASLEPDAIDLLTRYEWPGNVRELQNICERAVVLGKGAVTADLIGPWLRGQPAAGGSASVAGALADAAPSPVANGVHHGIVEPKAQSAQSPRTLEDVEREAIVATLQRFGGHRVKTAHALGIGVRTLGLKLKKWKELHLVSPSL